MKRLLLLVCLVVAALCLLPAAALAVEPVSNWTPMAMPSGSWHAISFVDDDHGFAAGGVYPDEGLLAVTSDGGTSWTTLPVPANLLTDVDFPDQDHGWVCGGTVCSTSDGGATWATYGIHDAVGVDFADTTHGLEWGGGYIGETSDGGATWNRTSMPVAKACMSDQTTAWAVSGSSVMTSTDGGLQWSVAAQDPVPNDYPLNSISFADPLHGYVASQGEIGATADGGASWTWQAADPGTLAIPALPGGWVWAATWDDDICGSDDGGVSWVHEHRYSLDPVALTADIVIRGDRGWMCTGAMAYATTRSGYGDLYPPVTTCVVPTWISASQTVTFSASDVGTGVAGTWWRLNGGPWTQSDSVPLTVDPLHPTTYFLAVASVDQYGNWELPRTFDTTTDALGPQPVCTPQQTYMMDYWNHVTSRITLSGIDAGIGGGGVKVRLGSGAWAEHPNRYVLVTPARANHGNDGVHIFTMHAFDDLGNIGASVTHAVCIDTRRPTGSVYAATGKARRSATFKFIVHDKRPCYRRARFILTVTTLHGSFLGYASGSCKKNRVITVTYDIGLRAGTYHYYLSADDGAGNTIKSPPHATLTVKSAGASVRLTSRTLPQMRLRLTGFARFLRERSRQG